MLRRAVGAVGRPTEDPLSVANSYSAMEKLKKALRPVNAGLRIESRQGGGYLMVEGAVGDLCGPRHALRLARLIGPLLTTVIPSGAKGGRAE